MMVSEQTRGGPEAATFSGFCWLRAWSCTETDRAIESPEGELERIGLTEAVLFPHDAITFIKKEKRPTTTIKLQVEMKVAIYTEKGLTKLKNPVEWSDGRKYQIGEESLNCYVRDVSKRSSPTFSTF